MKKRNSLIKALGIFLFVNISVSYLKSQEMETSFGTCFYSFSHYHEEALSAGTNSVLVTFVPGTAGSTVTPINTYTYPLVFTHYVTLLGGSFGQNFDVDGFGLHYKGFLGLGKDNDNDPGHHDNTNYKYPINLIELNILAGFDFGRIGLEAGARIGNFRDIDKNIGKKPGMRTTGNKRFLGHFGGKFRYGRSQIVFLQLIAGNPYFGLNGSKYTLSTNICTGLGRNDGTVLRIGGGGAGKQPFATAGLRVNFTKSSGIEMDGGWEFYNNYTFIYATYFFKFGG